jgi:ABC-type Fe3+/spermidine/putrescine transport system ATPase subunit
LCSRLGDHEIVVGVDAVEGPAWLVLRPEVITVRAPGPGAAIKGTVRDVSFRGTGSSYRVAVPGIEEPIKAEMSSGPVFPIGAEVALSWDSGSDVTLRRSSEEEA